MMITKDQFLIILESELAPLPPEEREELMEDYRSHFIFGLQNGKTEAEIASELGDPHEIAKEALQQRGGSGSGPVYWFYGQESKTSAPPLSGQRTSSEPFPASVQKGPKRRSAGAAVSVAIGLFFLNLLVVPLLLGLWSTVVGIAASGVGGVLSPLAVLLDYLKDGLYLPAKGFASLSMVGIGILLLILTKYLARWLYQLSANYAGWNVRAVRGGVKHD